MNKYIYDRVIDEANYIVETNMTIREVAEHFGGSKSSVHNDIRKRLVEIDRKLYKKVSNVMEYHIDIKHIRGGESTKRKFLERKM